jgi:putative transcriptional regulator
MKEELFNELYASLEEARDILNGKAKPSRIFTPEEIDPVIIRKSLKLSQNKFANLLGISSGTLRNWEQGIRVPTGSARILLAITAKHPEIVLETVHPKASRKGLSAV